MKLETLRLQSAGGVSTITLDRPGCGNAINVTMVRELEQVCDQLEDGSGDPVVVVRGAGEAFCRGIDLRYFPADAKPDVRGFARWEKACRTLERLSRVTVAAIDGACVGGGFQLALTCDVRLATRRSSFVLHEVRDGFLPGMGTFRLAKFIGLGRARRLALTGRRLGAEEAQQLGIVDHLCDPAEFEPAIAAAVAEFGQVHPDAVQLTRRLFDESFEMSYEDFIGCFLAAQHRAIQTPAFRERVRRAHAQSVARPDE